MKKSILFLILSPAFAFAQIPAGYYDAAAGLTGYALKSKLHDIITQKPYSYNYSDVTNFYATTDIDHYYENDGTILDIYSEVPNGADSYEYTPSQLVGSASAEGAGFNREHGMPQSTFYSIYPMYSDIHFLIPADAYINQRRSNYPYANNNGSSKIFSNGSKLGKSTVAGYTNTAYEPVDEFKGDVARYLLYFAVRYEGSLNVFNYELATSPLDGSEEKAYEDWYITMLKNWAAADPVSQREIDRNNAVYAIENVRNPFIDHPEYINQIWSVNPDTVAPDAPANLVVTNTGESFVSLSWQASQNADALGYKIYVNGSYIGYSKTNSFHADRLTPGTAYNFTVKTYDNGYLLSPDSNIVTTTTSAADNFAKDLMITKYVEGGANSEALEITNKTGHTVDLTNYYLSIQFKGANNTYYFGESYKLEGHILPGESKVVINPKANFPNYTVSQGDIITAGTPMTYTGTQYIELSYGKKYLVTASTNNYDMSYQTVDAVGYKNTSNTLSNLTMYRNTDVTDPNVSFTPSEWTEYPENYTVGLGDDNIITLSTSNNNFSQEVQLYPNPAEDRIYLKGANFSTKGYQIYDMAGNLTDSSEIVVKSGDYISIENLPAGKYVLKADKKSFSFIKK